MWNFGTGRKSCRYVGVGLRFWGLGFGFNRGGIEPQEMKLAAVQQLPLNLVARLQADGGGQRQRALDFSGVGPSAFTRRTRARRGSQG